MNPYQLLGVTRFSDSQTVDEAYAALCQKAGDNDELLRDLRDAYEMVAPYARPRSSDDDWRQSRQQRRVEQYRQAFENRLHRIQSLRHARTSIEYSEQSRDLGIPFDERQYSRYPLSGGLQMILPDQSYHMVELRDISAWGIGIHTDLPLRVGDSCLISSDISNGQHLEFSAEVIHVDPDNRVAGLAVRYIDPSSQKVLHFLLDYARQVAENLTQHSPIDDRSASSVSR